MQTIENNLHMKKLDNSNNSVKTAIKIENMKQEIYKNENDDILETKIDEPFLNYINSNIEKLTNEEIVRIHKKICPMSKMRYDVKMFCLFNGDKSDKLEESDKEFQNITLQEFKQFVRRIVHFYNFEHFEDSLWTYHDSNSEIYDLEKNEFIFANSICSIDYELTNVKRYLFHLIKKINSYSSNIICEYDTDINKKEKITWILIRCSLI